MGSCTILLTVALVTAPDGLTALPERLTTAQVVIAGDPFAGHDDRRRAVYALRSLGTAQAYEFLADHVCVQFLPRGVMWNEPPARMSAPFRYSLTHDTRDQLRREDRAVADAILRVLDRPRHDGDLASYASVLMSVLADRQGESGYERAQELLTGELARRPGAVRKANLEGILRWLYRNNQRDDAGRPLPRPNP